VRFSIINQSSEISLTPTQKNEFFSNFFLIFITFPFVLSLFGLVMLYSTSYDRGSTLFIKQLIWLFISLIGAFMVVLIGYKRIFEYSILFLAVVSVLLVLPRFFPPVKGAYRWIKFPGGVSFQPSELAKIAIIVFFARFCSTRQIRINNIKNVLLCMGVLAFISLLTWGVGKDLGTTILIIASSWAIFFAVGMRLLFLIVIPLCALPPLLFYIKIFDPERWSRIFIIFNPEADPQGSGYQLLNSIMALGSGGLTGLGFTESKMKAYYLPEAHTDFILAIAGEEFGFLGILFIILLYLGFFIISITISTIIKNREASLLVYGLGIMITIQALINLGVVSGLFPTKGMPAPFISYGGSNIFAAWISVAMISSVILSRGE